jgi:hypothetical protein
MVFRIKSIVNIETTSIEASRAAIALLQTVTVPASYCLCSADLHRCGRAISAIYYVSDDCYDDFAFRRSIMLNACRTFSQVIDTKMLLISFK